MSLSSLAEDAPADDPSPTDRVRRRRRRSRWSRLKRSIGRGIRNRSRVTSIGFTAIVLLVAFAAFRMVAAHKDLKAAEEAFLEARDAVSETRTEDAAEALDDAEQRLDAAKSKAGGFPLGLTRPIPVLGSPAKAVTDVVKAGRELVAAGRVINDAAASFPTAGRVAVDGHDLSQFHRAALEADQAIVTARRHVRLATAAVAGPSGALLPPISKPARSAAATIRDAAEQLGGADRGLRLLADLTAPDRSARILVLSQDTWELRPTGGFVGSYGVLAFDRGRVDLTEYQDAHALPEADPPLEAPAFLATHLPGPWGLENAMWWPHFPTSAAQAVELFRRQGGGEVDGVLAITQDTMARLVGAVGPVEVPGYDPVVEQGFADRVLHEVELKRPLDNPRKRFLTELSEVLIRRLFSLQPEELAEVAAAFRDGPPGDVQLWFPDADRQELITGTTWAGEMPSADRDFLMVVDANMTASKANRDLRRQILYQVRRDNDRDRVRGRVRISYVNEGRRSETNPYYSGFVRVYVPRGTRLLPSDRALKLGPLGRDGLYEVFGGFIFVRPGEEAEVTIDYELPKSVEAGGRYGLTWRRQPGTPLDDLRAVIGSTHFPHERGAGAIRLDSDLRPHPVRRFLHDRWIGRRLGL